MRYRGGAIGHKGATHATQIFVKNRELYAESEDEGAADDKEVGSASKARVTRQDIYPEDSHEVAPHTLGFHDDFWTSDEESRQPTEQQDNIEEDSDIEDWCAALRHTLLRDSYAHDGWRS
ncbi:hypothetical protein EV122DRAFT_281293 [Schizophyllum commune]